MMSENGTGILLLCTWAVNIFEIVLTIKNDVAYLQNKRYEENKQSVQNKIIITLTIKVQTTTFDNFLYK